MGSLTRGIKTAIISKIKYLVMGLFGAEDAKMLREKGIQYLETPDEIVNKAYPAGTYTGTAREQIEKEIREDKRRFEISTTKDIINYVNR